MAAEKITYRVIRSTRKTLALQILPDGEVVVRSPMGVSDRQIRAFVERKSPWIREQLQKLRNHPAEPNLTEEQLRILSVQAKSYIPGRVAHFAPRVGVTWGTITIRCQHTRWGSCSSKGNLNFNCLLMLCPPEVIDYVVVHELCHRKEMNHSAAFWAEVAQVLPEYAEHRNWLKTQGSALIARLEGK